MITEVLSRVGLADYYGCNMPYNGKDFDHRWRFRHVAIGVSSPRSLQAPTLDNLRLEYSYGFLVCLPWMLPVRPVSFTRDVNGLSMRNYA